MTDPRAQAMQIVADLLQRAERKTLRPEDCMHLVEQVRLVPGLVKRVAHVLSAQRTPGAVEALRSMPANVPGVVEGLYQAFAQGVTRRRSDATSCPPMLALEFRRSRARNFDKILGRTRAVFTDRFEALSVEGRLYYRVGLAAGPGTLAGRAAAVSHDLMWLHRALGKLRGTRLWLNGWPFPSDGPFSAAIQIHLLRGWLTWAGTQTQTRIS